MPSKQKARAAIIAEAAEAQAAINNNNSVFIPEQQIINTNQEPKSFFAIRTRKKLTSVPVAPAAAVKTTTTTVTQQQRQPIPPPPTSSSSSAMSKVKHFFQNIGSKLGLSKQVDSRERYIGDANSTLYGVVDDGTGDENEAMDYLVDYQGSNKRLNQSFVENSGTQLANRSVQQSHKPHQLLTKRSVPKSTTTITKVYNTASNEPVTVTNAIPATTTTTMTNPLNNNTTTMMTTTTTTTTKDSSQPVSKLKTSTTEMVYQPIIVGLLPNTNSLCSPSPSIASSNVPIVMSTSTAPSNTTTTTTLTTRDNKSIISTTPILDATTATSTSSSTLVKYHPLKIPQQEAKIYYYDNNASERAKVLNSNNSISRSNASNGFGSSGSGLNSTPFVVNYDSADSQPARGEQRYSKLIYESIPTTAGTSVAKQLVPTARSASTQPTDLPLYSNASLTSKMSSQLPLLTKNQRRLSAPPATLSSAAAHLGSASYIDNEYCLREPIKLFFSEAENGEKQAAAEYSEQKQGTYATGKQGGSSGTQQPTMSQFAKATASNRVPVTLVVEHLDIKHLNLKESAIQNVVDKVVTSIEHVNTRSGRMKDFEREQLSQLSAADMERRMVFDQRMRLEEAKRQAEEKAKKAERLRQQVPPPVKMGHHQVSSRNLKEDEEQQHKIPSPKSPSSETSEVTEYRDFMGTSDAALGASSSSLATSSGGSSASSLSAASLLMREPRPSEQQLIMETMQRDPFVPTLENETPRQELAEDETSAQITDEDTTKDELQRKHHHATRVRGELSWIEKHRFEIIMLFISIIIFLLVSRIKA